MATTERTPQSLVKGDFQDGRRNANACSKFIRDCAFSAGRPVVDVDIPVRIASTAAGLASANFWLK
jgi:hypothetical protein